MLKSQIMPPLLNIFFNYFNDPLISEENFKLSNLNLKFLNTMCWIENDFIWYIKNRQNNNYEEYFDPSFHELDVFSLQEVINLSGKFSEQLNSVLSN